MDVTELTWVKNNLGYSLEDLEFTEINATSFGKVVNINSQEESFYFKTDHVIACETMKTAYLSERFSHKTPELVASCQKNNWFITKSSGSEIFYSSRINEWHDAVKTLAQIHKTDVTAKDLDNLPTHEIHKDNFQNFVNSKEYLDYWDLTQEEQLELTVISGEILQAIEIVESHVTKHSICHGDAHAKNVLISNQKRISWFDWREAHIGNPIADFGFFLWWLMPNRQKLGIKLEVTQQIISDLSTTYQLELFGKVHWNSPKDLMNIGLAHRAMLFHRTYYPISEFKPFYVTYALRQLLKLNRNVT